MSAHSVYEGFISSFQDPSFGGTSTSPQALYVEQENLDIGYTLNKRNPTVSTGRGFGSFSQVPTSMKPQGTIAFAFRTDDCLRFFNAHFQFSQTNGGTEIVFSPNLEEARYSRYDINDGTVPKPTFYPETVTIVKKLFDSGTNAYVFKQGIVESLAMTAGVGLEAIISCGMRFLSVDAGSAVGSLVGAYSTHLPFESFQANVKLDGNTIDLSGFNFNSWQKLQDITAVGNVNPNAFKYLDYTLTGTIAFDLPSSAFTHIGSMIGTKDFSFTATLLNAANDKVVINMPVCRRTPFNFNQGNADSKLSVSMPFEAFPYGTSGYITVTVSSTSGAFMPWTLLDAKDGARTITSWPLFDAASGARTIATFIRFDRDA